MKVDLTETVKTASYMCHLFYLGANCFLTEMLARSFFPVSDLAIPFGPGVQIYPHSSGLLASSPRCPEG